jgi:hypothetical protein
MKITYPIIFNYYLLFIISLNFSIFIFYRSFNKLILVFAFVLISNAEDIEFFKAKLEGTTIIFDERDEYITVDMDTLHPWGG